MTEVMNSLEAGAEDFGGDGAGAGDEGVVSFQASLSMFLFSLPRLRLIWVEIIGSMYWVH